MKFETPKNTSTLTIMILFVPLAVAAVFMCSSNTVEDVSKATANLDPSLFELVPEPIIPREEEKISRKKPVHPREALSEFKALCEDQIHFNLKNGKRKYSRRFTHSDKRRTRRIIQQVAREMGANSRLFTIWALRESSYRPWKRHRLNPDREAAWVAWNRHRWTKSREKHYKTVMQTNSAKDGTQAYWQAKAGLRRILSYKDNPTFGAPYRWSTGLGLYGMQPIYHVKRWDPNAAPEILCDPIVATVVAVWAARTVRNNCVSKGFDDTYETVNRGYSSGSCKLRPKFAKYFLKRAVRNGLDPKAAPRLGRKWKRSETDRDEILAHMRSVVSSEDR